MDNSNAAVILQFDAGLIDEAETVSLDFEDVNAAAAQIFRYAAGIADEF